MKPLAGIAAIIVCAAAAQAVAERLSSTPDGRPKAGVVIPPAAFTYTPMIRLTLQSNTPVMTTTQSAKTAILLDCDGTNAVPVFNGRIDTLLPIPNCEYTVNLSASEEATANVFDVVGFSNQGVLGACVPTNNGGAAGTGWAGDAGSNTARGTGYSAVDRKTRPYVTIAGAIAHCFNGTTDYGPIQANQATLLGTFYTSAAGQVSWTFGSAASGGGASLLGLWNMFDRKHVLSTVIDNGAASYTYSSATFREARASTTNIVQIVSGLAEDSINAVYQSHGDLVGIIGAAQSAAVGLDTTTAATCQRAYAINTGTGNNDLGGPAVCMLQPQVGFHTISANEASDGANGNRFDVDSLNQLQVSLRM